MGNSKTSKVMLALVAAGVVTLATWVNVLQTENAVLMEQQGLVCGAYTQANEGMDGCEMLPGYTVIEGEPAEDSPLWDCRIHGNREC